MKHLIEELSQMYLFSTGKFEFNLSLTSYSTVQIEITVAVRECKCGTQHCQDEMTLINEFFLCCRQTVKRLSEIFSSLEAVA